MNLALLSDQAANITHVSTRSKGPASVPMDLSSQPPKKQLAIMAKQEQETTTQETPYCTCQATPKMKLQQETTSQETPYHTCQATPKMKLTQETMSQETPYCTCQATPKMKLSRKWSTIATPPPLISAAAIKSGNYLLVTVSGLIII